jgi:hypothetical protein
LGTATSSVLLNGVLGKVFHCKRGVSQGDPLSPLLFVLAADLLQSVINDAREQGLFNLLIQPSATMDFSIIQYADDTLLIMEACPTQFAHHKAILHTFLAAKGLKVNYNKSMMVPLNIEETHLDLCCGVAELPRTNNESKTSAQERKLKFKHKRVETKSSFHYSDFLKSRSPLQVSVRHLL